MGSAKPEQDIVATGNGRVGSNQLMCDQVRRTGVSKNNKLPKESKLKEMGFKTAHVSKIMLLGLLVYSPSIEGFIN